MHARLLIFAACAAVLWGQPADLILRNGKIVTLESATPVVQSLAVRGDRIAAVGSNADIAKLAGPRTRVLDLHGRLAIPGFIESHGHFTGIGEFRKNLDLREAGTWGDIVAMVGRAASKAKPGDWIIGRGWHQSKWSRVPEPNVDGFPVHDSLSRVSPRNPVLLTHASGHAAFVNQAAMTAAGITRETKDPPGGAILRDAKGNPTGLLQERAAGLVSKAMGGRRVDVRELVELATDECLSKGLTSFEDAGSPLATVDVMKQMADAGELRIRLWVMLRAPNPVLAPALDRYRVIGEGNNFLTVRAIKRQIDGALGSRGAWLLEPYADLPADAVNRSGLNTEDPADIARTAELAKAHGYQLCVHAIGDRANRETLDIFEKALGGRTALRWRVEHAQHLNATDIPRFAKLGVIAAMQGIHCTSDAPYVLARLGAKRAGEGAYVWQKLMKSGAVVSNGTDAPVEDVSPIASYYATVSRKLKDGSVFFGDQRMSREEALRSYTIQGAYAAFEENLKGTLKPGKLADITVLSRDILTVPEEEIPSTDVVYTIVGGKIAYENRARTAVIN